MIYAFIEVTDEYGPLAGIIAAATVAVIITLVFLVSWNMVMPSVFNLPTITFWQSLWLLIVGNILFKLK